MALGRERGRIVTIFEQNCPIRERTGGGASVGRCWFHSPGDVCPRHGDESEPLRAYRETGELTDELDFDPKLAAAVRRNRETRHR